MFSSLEEISRQRGIELPGVFGPAAMTRSFATAWSETRGRLSVLNGEMTFFTLESVSPFLRPEGSLRAARDEDFAELMPITIAAAREMNLPAPEQDPEQVEKGLRRAIAEARQCLDGWLLDPGHGVLRECARWRRRPHSRCLYFSGVSREGIRNRGDRRAGGMAARRRASLGLAVRR